MTTRRTWPCSATASTADYNDVSRVVAGLDQGGLGMPSGDFDLKDDDNSKAIREKYVTLIKSLLKLGAAGDTDAAKDADMILRLETAMAQAQMDNISRRDPEQAEQSLHAGPG